MTKEEAKSTLIKDIAILLVGFIIGGIIGLVGFKPENFGDGILFFCLFGMVVGGVPLGWKWASKVITAVGLLSIVFKFFLSWVLGWIAAPVTVIKDIILFVKIMKEKKNDELSEYTAQQEETEQTIN